MGNEKEQYVEMAYARVSTKSQSLERQEVSIFETIPDLKAKYFYKDIYTGKKFDRPEYQKLKKKYIVLDISFESADDCFTSLYTLAQGFVNKVADALENNDVQEELMQRWMKPVSRELPLNSLSKKISDFCKFSDREVILMVDEVDKNSDNQIFLSFLGLVSPLINICPPI